MAEAFKFVHASDFHLDQPLRGLTEFARAFKKPNGKCTVRSSSESIRPRNFGTNGFRPAIWRSV